MKRIIHPSAISLSGCCMVALTALWGCDQGRSESGDLEDRVRAAEFERDAMKEEIAELRASPAGGIASAEEAELVIVEEELKMARAENARIREEITDFKKKFPLPGENSVEQ